MSARSLACALSLFVVACQDRDRPDVALPSESSSASSSIDPGPVGPPRERPDIVILMADDMGYSDIAPYGGEIRTPTLDRLAKGGIRFRQFYNAGRCCPTRASLLTGLYPHQADIGAMMTDDGIDGYRGNLSPDSVTIAEVLKGAGYHTAIAGKWHVTNQLGLWYHVAGYRSKANWPLQRGFDSFYGTIHAAASYYDPVSLCRDNDPISPESPTEGPYYYTDAIADAAVEFIEGVDRAEPLFLYVPFTAPHWPLHALDADIERYRGRYDDGWDALREERWKRMRDLGVVDASWELSARDPRYWEFSDSREPNWESARMEVYAAQIDRMDQAIGRVVSALEKMGRLRDTLLIFLADNGGSDEEVGLNWRGLHIPVQTRDGRGVRIGNDPRVDPGPDDTYQSYGGAWANASNTPFRWYKSYAHEGGIATPLIVHWPNGITDPDRWSDSVGHVVDLMATCVSVAKADYPTERAGVAVRPMEGKSLDPLFREIPRDEHEALCWEHEGNRAVRCGDWKLVARRGGPWELYNLATDRGETRNVIASEANRAAELLQRYDAWCGRVGVVPWSRIEANRRR